jgi:hypothetical protein
LRSGTETPWRSSELSSTVTRISWHSGYFGQKSFNQTVRTPMLGQQRDAALIGIVVDPIEIGMQVDRGGLAGVSFDSVDPLDCAPPRRPLQNCIHC